MNEKEMPTLVFSTSQITLREFNCLNCTTNTFLTINVNYIPYNTNNNNTYILIINSVT